MKKVLIEKCVLTAVMVAWLVWMPVVGYGGGGCGDAATYGTVVAHCAYMVSHGNVWHLAGNLFVLWLMKGRLYLLPSVLIAFLCSFIPAWGFWGIGMTVGFSGVLFATAGIKWGVYCQQMPSKKQAYEKFCVKALPFSFIFAVVPHINWCLHLYCMLIGFVYGRCYPRPKDRKY